MADYLDYFTPQIDGVLAEIRDAEGGWLIGEALVPELRQVGRRRIARVTNDYMQMRMAELLADENPFAAADFSMVTKREREKMQPVLLEKL